MFKGKALTNVIIGSIGLLALILAIFLFFFIIPSEKRDALAWVNFGTVVWLIIINFVGLFFISQHFKQHEDIFPAYIATGTVIFLYTLLSILAALISFTGLGHKVVMTIQVVLFFLFVVIEVIAVLSLGVVKNVKETEDARRVGVTTVRTDFDMINLKVNKLPVELKNVKDKFAGIKDNVRYISPNDSPAAVQLDSQINQILLAFVAEVDAVLGLAPDNAANNHQNAGNKMLAKLDELAGIVDLRKRAYSS